MDIPRDALIDNIRSFVLSGNGVIIGAPGVGKTYSLKQLAEDLLNNDIACLYLPIDKLGVDQESTLSAELGIKGDLVSYLNNENRSNNTGVLIIDAFDAARSEVAQQLYLRIIRRVQSKLKGRWNVIVSVRSYDARKSEDLQDLFPLSFGNQPSSEYQTKGIHCRHFFVPKLMNAEVKQAANSIPYLTGFYEKGSEDFKELLRIPFNLWLLEKLLSINPNISELSSISSEVQLLGLFWNQRVNSGIQGEDKRALLSKVAGRMVAQRSLSVRKDEVYNIGDNDIWRTLLSEEILSESTTTAQRVIFSHNILFDYAVAILFIEDEPENAIEFITKDLSRPLFLRPSLNYHFTRLWYDTPDSFWKSLFHILPSPIPNLRLFARLIPTSVIVNEARTIEQLNPILNLLNEKRPIVTEIVLRLLQSLRALKAGRDELWIRFFYRISDHVQHDFAWDLAILTSEILERALKTEENEIVKITGQTGRNIFKWSWRQREEKKNAWLDNLGGRLLVPLVSKTFWTNQSESRSLLEKVLELSKEENFPIDYLYSLTTEIKKIWPFDPDFVASIYGSVFTHYETSEEKTNMGTPVLPMTSTRRQDYDMCQHSLIRHFPKFLREAPSSAMPAVINCLNYFIIGRHIAGYLKEGINLEDLPVDFFFRGKTAKYMQDGSYIWDASEYHDEPIKMADDLFDYISKISSSEPQDRELDCALDIFRDHVYVAFFWRRLLQTASHAPQIFADRIFDLCIAHPVQTGPETIHELGMFLEAAAPIFTHPQLKKIEDTIIDLPNDRSGSKKIESLEHLRDRLLARIPLDLLQTDEAKKIRRDMMDADKVPPNEPLAKFTSWSGPYTTEKWLKDQGADLEKPENQALQRFFAPLDAFTSEWQNKIPNETSINSIFPLLKETYGCLKGTVNADKPVLNFTWTKLASCMESISKGCVDPETEAFQFCREILLICAGHKMPEPDPEYDSKFDHPHWSPAPRNEAAQGLPWLAIRLPDADIMSAIWKLIKDPVPSVRWLVTSEIWRLYTKTPDTFWTLAEYVANNEDNRTIQNALCRSLSHIMAREEMKSVDILKKLFEKLTLAEKESDLLDSLVSLLVWLVVVRENTWATTTFDKFLKEPINYSKVFKRAAFDSLSYINPKNLDNDQDAYNLDKAIKCLYQAIDAAADGIKQIQRIPDYQSNEDKLTRLRNLYGVMDEAVMRIYFASDVRNKTEDQAKKNISEEQRKEFYLKIKPILTKVIQFALDKGGGLMFASTAHHFMELLNGVLKYDPQGVLHLAIGVAKSSEPFGYNLDSMAIREVVTLVESILADYRGKVREGESLQDLLDLLDVFAKTGWPDALRLVWRLDEVFR